MWTHTKAVRSSGNAHGRSALTAADNNNNAVNGNEVAHDEDASATTTPHATTRSCMALHCGRPQFNQGNNASIAKAKMPAQRCQKCQCNYGKYACAMMAIMPVQLWQ